MTTTLPIMFLIFNRPDTTSQVFETIRAAKMGKLLVITDGPRANRPGEAEKSAARRTIVDGVVWDCGGCRRISRRLTLLPAPRLLRQRNLGLRAHG